MKAFRRIVSIILVFHVFAATALLTFAADVAVPESVRTIKASQLKAAPYNATAADSLIIYGRNLTLDLDTDLVLNQLLCALDNRNLTITGNGSLTILNNGTKSNTPIFHSISFPAVAIRADSLTINSGTIALSSSNCALLANDIIVNNGNIILEGTTYTFQGRTLCAGAVECMNFTMNGGNVIATGNEGIRANKLHINGGSLTAIAKNVNPNKARALVAADGNVAELVIKGGTITLEAPVSAVSSLGPISILPPATIIEPAGAVIAADSQAGWFTIKNADGSRATKVVITSGAPSKAAASSQQTTAQVSDDFDAAFYAALYPDVVAVFGTDPAALYQHYVQYGKKEGRFPNPASAPVQ